MLVRISDYQAGLFEIVMRTNRIDYETVDESEETEEEFDLEPMIRFFRD